MPGEENGGIMDSIRERIIKAFISRLAIIRVDNGFNTDCGLNVSRAVRNLDPDALPAVIVWPRKDENEPFYEQTGLTLPIDVELYMIQRIDITPSEQSEQMLADVIEAAMGIEWSAPFTAGASEPSAGDEITGNDSDSSAWIQSVAVSSGTWGGGDAAGTLTLRRKDGAFTSELVSITDGDADALTIAGGSITGTGSKDLAAGGLAIGIYYTGGGTDTYPDSDNDTVAVQGNFSFLYHTADGDPYRVA
jgi:hypothetical protein